MFYSTYLEYLQYFRNCLRKRICRRLFMQQEGSKKRLFNCFTRLGRPPCRPLKLPLKLPRSNIINLPFVVNGKLKWPSKLIGRVLLLTQLDHGARSFWYWETSLELTLTLNNVAENIVINLYLSIRYSFGTNLKDFILILSLTDHWIPLTNFRSCFHIWGKSRNRFRSTWTTKGLFRQIGGHVQIDLLFASISI